jgi:hypothetical protein
VIDLTQLPPATPVPQAAERVRRRCHAALATRPAARRSRLDGVLFAAAAVYLLSALISLVTFFLPSIR